MVYTNPKAFDIERAELETGYGLRKLGIITMQAAIKVMQLKQARDEEEHQISIETVFEEKEQECLNELLPQLEGNTEKFKKSLFEKPISLGNLDNCSIRWLEKGIKAKDLLV